MTKTIHTGMLLAVVIGATGCATPYMMDRERDAADIFTVSTGIGGGIKAQCGPVASGLSWMADVEGLRGGSITKYPGGCASWGMMDVNFVVYGGEEFNVLHGVAQQAGAENYETLEPRHKCYRAPCILGLSFPLTLPGDPWSRGHLYRLTQIEIAGGIYRTVRIGFNPGELIDFILGWTTIDMFDDDLEMKRSNEASQAIVANAPQPER